MLTRTKSSSIIAGSSSHSHSARSKSPAPADWDADDETEATMSGDDAASLPPTSTSSGSTARQTHLPSCAVNKRPSLRDILSNKSTPPWTLTAFMAYLSNNHCLETLEFTMDATRYRKHYTKVMAKSGSITAGSKDSTNMIVLWNRLTDAYIRPNGSREINIPSEVRDPILNMDTSTVPPPPETLDRAVQKVYELMEESVLVPFLNSMSPVHSSSPTGTCDCQSPAEEPVSPQDESLKTRRARFGKHSPPTSSSPLESPSMPWPISARKTGSSLTTAMHKHRLSTRLSPTSSHTVPITTVSSMDAVSGPGLTDDSGYTSSYTSESIMTPPMSPPESDPGTSPRNSRDGSTWKKLGRFSQWKPMRKKSYQSFREADSLP